MIRDTLTTFATAVAASATAGTKQFGDVVDVQAMGPTTNVGTNLGGQRDIGSGGQVRVFATVDTSYAGSATIVTYQVVTSDNPNLTSGVVLLTTTPAVTDMIAGATILDGVLPTEGAAYKRYLGVLETVAGTTTAGKASIGVQPDDRTIKPYAQGNVGF